MKTQKIVGLYRDAKVDPKTLVGTGLYWHNEESSELENSTGLYYKAA